MKDTMTPDQAFEPAYRLALQREQAWRERAERAERDLEAVLTALSSTGLLLRVGP